MGTLGQTKKVLTAELLKMLDDALSSPCTGDEGLDATLAKYRYTLAASKLMEAVELLNQVG